MTVVEKIRCECCGYVEDVTGFAEVMPPCPECGDTSSWVRVNIPPVEMTEAEKEAVDQATAQAKETGFEDIMPAAPESGDMSTVALNSIKPVKDEPAAKLGRQEYKCETCGETISAYSDELPPCPECGDIGSWTLANLGVRR